MLYFIPLTFKSRLVIDDTPQIASVVNLLGILRQRRVDKKTPN